MMACLATSNWWLGRLGTVIPTNYTANHTRVVTTDGASAVLYPCRSLVKIFGRTAVLQHDLDMFLSLLLPLLLGIILGSYFSFFIDSRRTYNRNKSSLHQRNSKQRKRTFLTETRHALLSVFKGLLPSNVPVPETDDDTPTTEPNNRRNTMEPNYKDTFRESGVEPCKLPKHIAVIMDGNRRYAARTYGMGSSFRGHQDGSRKAIQFVEWCHTEGIPVVTCFAFSTENWNRPAAEVDALMALCERWVRHDLRPLAFNRQIRFNHLYTDRDRIPTSLLEAVDELSHETKDFQGTTVLNICMSYGGRSELVQAAQSLAQQCVEGRQKPSQITEVDFSNCLTTAGMPEPDVLFRTSGERRISNFLLWQLAYAEMFFAKCDWPEVTKQDLLQVLRQYASGRHRRFGR